jgi:hypothetical protein
MLEEVTNLVVRRACGPLRLAPVAYAPSVDLLVSSARCNGWAPVGKEASAQRRPPDIAGKRLPAWYVAGWPARPQCSGRYELGSVLRPVRARQAGLWVGVGRA